MSFVVIVRILYHWVRSLILYYFAVCPHRRWMYAETVSVSSSMSSQKVMYAETVSVSS